MKISTKFNLFVGFFFFFVIISVFYSYCGGLHVCYSFPFFNAFRPGAEQHRFMVTSYVVNSKGEMSRDKEDLIEESDTAHNTVYFHKIHPGHGLDHDKEDSNDPPSVITGKVAMEILRKANVSKEEANRTLYREEKVDKNTEDLEFNALLNENPRPISRKKIFRIRPIRRPPRPMSKLRHRRPKPSRHGKVFKNVKKDVEIDSKRSRFKTKKHNQQHQEEEGTEVLRNVKLVNISKQDVHKLSISDVQSQMVTSRKGDVGTKDLEDESKRSKVTNIGTSSLIDGREEDIKKPKKLKGAEKMLVNDAVDVTDLMPNGTGRSSNLNMNKTSNTIKRKKEKVDDFEAHDASNLVSTDKDQDKLMAEHLNLNSMVTMNKSKEETSEDKDKGLEKYETLVDSNLSKHNEVKLEVSESHENKSHSNLSKHNKEQVKLKASELHGNKSHFNTKNQSELKKEVADAKTLNMHTYKKLVYSTRDFPNKQSITHTRPLNKSSFPELKANKEVHQGTFRSNESQIHWSVKKGRDFTINTKYRVNESSGFGTKSRGTKSRGDRRSHGSKSHNRGKIIDQISANQVNTTYLPNGMENSTDHVFVGTGEKMMTRTQNTTGKNTNTNNNINNITPFTNLSNATGSKQSHHTGNTYVESPKRQHNFSTSERALSYHESGVIIDADQGKKFFHNQQHIKTDRNVTGNKVDDKNRDVIPKHHSINVQGTYIGKSFEETASQNSTRREKHQNSGKLSLEELTRSVRNIKDRKTRNALTTALEKDKEELQKIVFDLKTSYEKNNLPFSLSRALRDLVKRPLHSSEGNQRTEKRSSDKTLVRVKRLRKENNVGGKSASSDRTLVRVKRIDTHDRLLRSSNSSDKTIFGVKRKDINLRRTKMPYSSDKTLIRLKRKDIELPTGVPTPAAPSDKTLIRVKRKELPGDAPRRASSDKTLIRVKRRYF